MSKRVSFIDQGIEEWTQVLPLLHSNLYSLISHLSLHSNNLRNVDAKCIGMLTALISLDLSSNNVWKIKVAYEKP